MEAWRVFDLLQGLLVIGGIFVVFYSPIARGIANRLMHGKTPPPGVPLDDPRVDEVLADNQMLRRQLEEMQERVQFAERMLAQTRKAQLPGSA